MFVMYEKEKMKVPVRVWLKEREDLEGSCLEQAYHLSQLPFLHKWVSLMPDTHAGMGMPIGGVIAADGVVIPKWVWTSAAVWLIPRPTLRWLISGRLSRATAPSSRLS